MAGTHFEDMMHDEATEEARNVVETILEFIKDNPRFRLGAIIAAAIDDDTGEIFANDLSLTSEEGRAAMLDALKEGGRREVDPVVN